MEYLFIHNNYNTELTAVIKDEIDINILQKQDGELKAEIHFDVSNVSLEIGEHTISISKQVYRMSIYCINMDMIMHAM